MSAEIVQNWLIAISFVVTTIVTIVIQVRVNTNNKKSLLNQQLFEIQRLAFNYPHVDNKDYTTQWNDLKVNIKFCKKDKSLLAIIFID